MHDRVHRTLGRWAEETFERILVSRDARALLQDARARNVRAAKSIEEDPVALRETIKDVVWIWNGLALICGLLMVAAAYAGHQAFGAEGRTIAGAVVAGCGRFCLTGGFYATYKSLLASSAVRLYQRDGAMSEKCRRLMERARLRDRSLVLQAVVGIATMVIIVIAYY